MKSLLEKCAALQVLMIDELPDNIKNFPFRIYFDNLFTGMKVFSHFKICGYGATGTICETGSPKIALSPL